MKFYKVQTQHPVLEWRDIPFAESKSRAYCDGYVDCMDSHYPSAPCRIIRIADGVETVVRETRGRGDVHTN